MSASKDFEWAFASKKKKEEELMFARVKTFTE